MFSSPRGRERGYTKKEAAKDGDFLLNSIHKVPKPKMFAGDTTMLLLVAREAEGTHSIGLYEEIVDGIVMGVVTRRAL